MPALHKDLRNQLSRTIVQARQQAEAGARKAIESLAVHHHEPHAGMSPAKRDLRRRLRARGRQLGDRRDANRGTQTIDRLTHEVAYEQWHRMLFARFLAENDLLIHPEHRIAVTLEEIEELARETGEDPRDLAARYAQDALPQIFRRDDPVLEVDLAPETRQALSRLLASLPTPVFTADDSLGWTYQFWQAEKKKAVNESGVKIGANELPAVTQLFTEHYMVLFLLHNTVGAWWAGKVLANNPDLAVSAADEAELRQAVRLQSLGGYDFEYLRFVRDKAEGDADHQATGPWRPAAGTFDGWPDTVAELTVLDPCCGSGHFLVALLDLLVRLHMDAAGLPVNDAVDTVLRDNLFGLELDPRCTQIAAFNVALAAWKLPGAGFRELPHLNIACCGIGPQATKDDWLKMAECELNKEPPIAREPMRRGLIHMHELFSDAPELGSLIDPADLPAEGFAADFETIKPLLDHILAAESADDDAYEQAIAARGMAATAEILTSDYTLIITNVPYLKGGDHGKVLKRFCEEKYPDAKYDIANVMTARSLRMLSPGGSSGVVCQQYWLFLKYCDGLRNDTLRRFEIPLVARLGPGAFESISGDVVNVCLQIINRRSPSSEYVHTGSEIGHIRNLSEKIEALRNGPMFSLQQAEQLKNPDYRISFEPASTHTGLLSDVADFGKGSVSGDGYHYLRKIWEIDRLIDGHRCWLNSPSENGLWCGREDLILWGIGNHNPEEQKGFRFHGQRVFGKRGVAIGKAGRLRFTPYNGELFDDNIAVVCPFNDLQLEAVWAFCRSDEFLAELRRLDKKMSVTAGTFTKVACSPEEWKPAARNVAIREPESDDPTQWLFHGRPEASTDPLQVAVARLLGYRWPAELDKEMRLSDRARELVGRCDELLSYADDDGIVCLSATRGERAAADRLRDLLAAAYGGDWSTDKEAELLTSTGNGKKLPASLDAWLRESYFEQHCKLFHHRPFVWHLWDGQKDGFNCLVNAHKLTGPDGLARRTLEAITYSYLGEWIDRQKAAQAEGVEGSDAKLAAALDLQERLEKILEGEPPYDLFVRWKPLHEQAIGWEPDINDGMRMNIRPFMKAELRKGGKKGAGLLRWKPNIKWTKDRGKEPKRPKAEYPWFWSAKDGVTDFAGGKTFDGNRWNSLHYKRSVKQAARDAAAARQAEDNEQ